MQFFMQSSLHVYFWVAFLIQDTVEWKPCVVNTQCGRQLQADNKTLHSDL